MMDLNKLAILISKPEYFEYFFKKLDKPELFDWLSGEIKAFDNIPKPQLTDDGQYLQFPPWLPGQYLIKVANKIPDKVFKVINQIETDNHNALDDCEQSILKMPDGFLIKNHEEIIGLLDRWLDSKYTGHTHRTSIDLFRRYLDSGFFEGACKLLDILSKSKKEETRGVKFRFKTYNYQKLVKEVLPVLIENKPLMVLDIIEKRLKEAIENEIQDETSEDASIGWRSAIEDSPQNLGYDDVRNILLVVLRDALYSLSLKEPAKAEEIIKRYLEERLSVCRRLAVHIIRESSFKDLAVILLTDKNNLDRVDIHHEFFKLMQDQFSVLNSDQKNQFVEWILEGHFKISIDDEKKLERYRKNWQASRLCMLKEHIEKDGDLKQFRCLLDEYKDDLKGIVHPDFLSYHTSWHGPTSSLGKEEIAKMKPEEFVHWIKNNLQAPFEMMGPTPEGVSREFKEAVRENPEIYALATEIFLDEKIYPAYLCGLIRGLEEAIKAGQAFNLEPVIKFIESPLKFSPELEVKTEHDEFDVGQYSWLRGSISNLIEALVAQDKICLSQDNMDITQNVLVELIEKDEYPTEDSEKQYGPEAKNMDYVGFCINSNRGKAMHALIRHALRREHMRPKEKEEGKDLFPSGEKMDLYKEFFSQRLDEEPSPSVQSSYGEYLVQFFYLDQKWVEQMKKQEKLFPMAEERSDYWDAHWQGYIAFSNFFDRIYDLLKEDYQKAVMKLTDKKERNHHDDRLAEHLMFAYWNKLEEIDKEGEILDIFFKNACPPIRAHAIWFLTDVIEEIKPAEDSEEWKILKALWQYRIAKGRDEEIASFVNWLKYCPEDLDDIANLIIPIIPYLHIGYQEDDLLEYISEKIETNTISGLLLLNKLLEIRESFKNIHFNLYLIREILTKAGKYRDKPDIADSINYAINHLGKMGCYDFKDLLIEKH